MPRTNQAFCNSDQDKQYRPDDAEQQYRGINPHGLEHASRLHDHKARTTSADEQHLVHHGKFDCRCLRWVLAVRKRNRKTNFCVFFALRMTIGPKIPGAVIPRRVFTQPGSFSSDQSAPDALGMSASLRLRPNLRTAAIRRDVPLGDSCTAANNSSELRGYWITLSARSTSRGGTSKPIAFATCRLMASSKVVGCSTGTLPTFSPLKIFASCRAICRYISVMRGP